jgi:hypothetical protein
MDNVGKDVKFESSKLYQFTITNKNGTVTKTPIPCEDWLAACRVKDEVMRHANIQSVDFQSIQSELTDLSTKNYPVIQVPASGKPVWYGGARAMLFVYSKGHGNFILEGYSKEVEEYLKKNYTHYFYRYTYWCNGKSRGGWKFWKEGVGIMEPSKVRKEWKYTIRKWTGGRHSVTVEESNKTALKLKRLPKRWIPEFNKF